MNWLKFVAGLCWYVAGGVCLNALFVLPGIGKLLALVGLVVSDLIAYLLVYEATHEKVEIDDDES